MRRYVFERPTLHAVILGGSLGNMVGGVAMIVAAYVEQSVLVLALGALCLICGVYVHAAEQEVERRRRAPASDERDA